MRFSHLIIAINDRKSKPLTFFTSIWLSPQNQARRNARERGGGGQATAAEQHCQQETLGKQAVELS
jgi:hypothetical protein